MAATSASETPEAAWQLLLDAYLHADASFFNTCAATSTSHVACFARAFPPSHELNLEYEFSEQQRAAFARRAADLQALLSSGVREQGSKSITLSRFLEELACTLAPVGSATRANNVDRLAVLQALLARAKQQRDAAVVPFVRPLARLRPDAQAFSVKTFALEALAALEDACTHTLSNTQTDSIVQPVAHAVAELLRGVPTGGLYDDWAPPRLPPECPLIPASARIRIGYAGAPLDVDPRRITASGNGSTDTSAAASRLDAPLAVDFAAAGPAWSAGNWRTDKSSANIMWGLSFGSPQPVSSVRIFWAGAAPREVCVEITRDPLPDPLAFSQAVPCTVAALAGGDAPSVAPAAHVLMDTPLTAKVAAALNDLITHPTIDNEGKGARAVCTRTDLPTGVPSEVTWETVATLEVPDSQLAAEPVSSGPMPCSHLLVGGAPSGACLRITGIRLVLKGRHPRNSRRAVGFAGLQLMTIDPARTQLGGVVATDRILNRLQTMVSLPAPSSGAAAGAKTLHTTGLDACLQLAMASGSQAALLRYVTALLGIPRGERLTPTAAANAAVAAAVAPLAEHGGVAGLALRDLRGRIDTALNDYSSRAAMTVGSGGSQAMNLTWDRAAASGSGLDYTNENRTVTATAYGNALAVGSIGVSEGVVTWELTLDQDSNDDEHSCFGVTTKPISSANYESSHAWMYRSYNGELYGTGKASGTKRKIHPNNRVRIRFDAEAGTLAFWVEDEAQGDCFTGLRGKTLFLAVAVYSSSVRVSITKCEYMPPRSRRAEAPAAGTSALEQALRQSLAQTGIKVADAPASAAVSAPATVAAAVEAPEPVKPELPAEFDEAVQRAAHPEVEFIVGMGFHWARAAAALQATGGNLEQAIERVLSGAVPEEVETTADARISSHARAVADWERAHAEWVAKREADRKREAAARATPAPAPAATRAPASAASYASVASPVDVTGTASLLPGGDGSPRTALYAAGAILGTLERLAGAYTPGLLPGGVAVLSDAASKALEKLTSTRAVSAAKPAASAASAGAAASTATIVDLPLLPAVVSHMSTVALCEPFALQADAANFEELSRLLSWFVSILLAPSTAALPPKERSQISTMLLATLRLVRANLARLALAHVDVAEAGFTSRGSDAFLAALHSSLQKLMQSTVPEQLQVAAVNVVDTGMTVLYPTPNSRAALLGDLLQKYSKERATMSSAQQDLLSRCLAFFATTQGVASLLPPLSSTAPAAGEDASSQTSSILQLVSVLLQLLNDDTTRAMHEAVSAGGTPTARTSAIVRERALALLSSFQRQLLGIVMDEVAAAERSARGSVFKGVPAPNAHLKTVELQATEDAAMLDARLAGSKWVPAANAADAPACRVLVAYTLAVLRCCATLAKHAHALLDEQHTRLAFVEAGAVAPLPADVEPELRRSVLAEVLPALSGGLALLSGQPWLAAAVLPAVVQVAGVLDSLAEASARMQAELRKPGFAKFKTLLLESEKDSASPQLRRFMALQLLHDDAIASAALTPPPPISGRDQAWTDAKAVADPVTELFDGFLLWPVAGGGGSIPAEVALWLPLDLNRKIDGAGDAAAAEWDATGIVALPWVVFGPDAALGAAHWPSLFCHMTASFKRVLKTNAVTAKVTVEVPNLTKLTSASAAAAGALEFTSEVVHVAGYMPASSKHLVGRCHRETDVATAAGNTIMAAINALAAARMSSNASSPAIVDEALLRTSSASPAQLAALWPSTQRTAPATALRRAVAARMHAHKQLLVFSRGTAVGAGDALEAAVEARAQAARISSVWTSSVSRITCMAGARLAATLIAGPHVSYEEEQLKPLLRSHLFSGGVRVAISAPSPAALSFHDVCELPLLWPSAGDSSATPSALMPSEDFAALLDDANVDEASEEDRAFIVDALRVTGEESAGTVAATGKLLHDWLQATVKESNIKRRQGVFPEVEITYLLALLRHTDALAAARIAVSALRSGRTATLPVPPEIAAAWHEVMLVRAHLRAEKSTKREVAATEGSGARDTAASASALRRLAAPQQTSFDSVHAGVLARARLLLTLCPAQLPSSALPMMAVAPVKAASSGLSRSLSAITDRLMQTASSQRPESPVDLADGPPMPAGRPGLGLGRQVSFAPVADDFEDAVDMPTPSSAAAGAATLKDVAVEFASPTLSDPTSDAVFRAAKLYVRYGLGAPPVLLHRVMQWRIIRAAARSYGFKAMLGLLQSTSQAPEVAVEALVHLRTPQRGVMERLNDSIRTDSKGRTDAHSDRAWLLRHHFALHLEGIPRELAASLAGIHSQLQAQLRLLLEAASARRDVRTASLVMWNWGCDVPLGDHDAMLHGKALDVLAQHAAVDAIVKRHGDDPALDDDVSAFLWRPWALQDVERRLTSGALSKFDVLRHMAAAPAVALRTLHPSHAGTGADWMRKFLGSSDAHALAGSMSCVDVLRLYTMFSSPSTASGELESPVASVAPSVTVDDVVAGLSFTVDAAAVAVAVSGATSAPSDSRPVLPRANSSSGGSGSSASGAPASAGVAVPTSMKTMDEAVLTAEVMRRSTRTKPTRPERRHPAHAAHTLSETLDTVSRHSTASCDVCRTTVRHRGPSCFTCAGCDFDVCAVCFAARPAAAEWEKPPVRDVSYPLHGETAPLLVPGLPVKLSPMYCDSILSGAEAGLPWLEATGREWWWTMRLQRHSGSVPVDKPLVTFHLTRPVRVWLLMPQMHLGSSGVVAKQVSWVVEQFEVVPRPQLAFRKQMTLLRGKRVFVPTLGAPEWAAGHTVDELSLNGLGTAKTDEQDWGYTVLLESIPVTELSPQDVMGDVQPAADVSASSAIARVASPIRPAALIARASWAALRVLGLLIAGDGSAAGDADDSAAAAAAAARMPSFLVMPSPGAAATTPMSDAAALPPRLALLPTTSVIVRDVEASRASTTATAQLRAWLFAFMLEQLTKASAPAARSCSLLQAHSKAVGGPGRDLELVEAEAIVFQILQFLFAACDTSSAKVHLSSAAYVMMWLQLIVSGSPRVQRMAMRILAAVASRTEPAVLEACISRSVSPAVCAVWNKLACVGSEHGSSTCAAGMLFDIIASPTMPSVYGGDICRPMPLLTSDSLIATGIFAAHAVGSAAPKSAELRTFGAGDLHQAAASEAVALTRTLLGFKEWRSHVLPCMLAAVQARDTSAEGVAAAVASLSVLGAFVEPLRVGAHALVTSSRLCTPSQAGDLTRAQGPRAGGAAAGKDAAVEMHATVIRVDAPSAAVHVVYSHDLSAAPAVVDAARVLPLSGVQPPLVVLDEAVVTALCALLSAGSAASAPTLHVRLAGMAAVVVQAMASRLNVDAFAGKALLHALCTLALKPLPLQRLIPLPALIARYRALEARTWELAVPPSIPLAASDDADVDAIMAHGRLHSPSAAVARLSVAVTALAADTGVPAPIAAAVLALVQDRAAAASILRTHRLPQWITAGELHAQYTGHVRLHVEDRSAAHFLRVVAASKGDSSLFMELQHLLIPVYPSVGVSRAVRDVVELLSAGGASEGDAFAAALEAAIDDAPAGTFGSIVHRTSVTISPVSATTADGCRVLRLRVGTEEPPVDFTLTSLEDACDVCIPPYLAAVIECIGSFTLRLFAMASRVQSDSTSTLSDASVMDLVSLDATSSSSTAADKALLVADEELLAFSTDPASPSTGRSTSVSSADGSDAGNTGRARVWVLPHPAIEAARLNSAAAGMTGLPLPARLKAAFPRTRTDASAPSVTDAEFVIVKCNARNPVYVGLSARTLRVNASVGQVSQSFGLSSDGQRHTDGSKTSVCPALVAGARVRFLAADARITVYVNDAQVTSFDVPTGTDVLLPAVTLNSEGDSVTLTSVSPRGVSFDTSGSMGVSSSLTVSDDGLTLLLEEATGGFATALASKVSVVAVDAHTSTPEYYASELLHALPSELRVARVAAGAAASSVEDMMVKGAHLIAARMPTIFSKFHAEQRTPGAGVVHVPLCLAAHVLPDAGNSVWTARDKDGFAPYAAPPGLSAAESARQSLLMGCKSSVTTESLSSSSSSGALLAASTFEVAFRYARVDGCVHLSPAMSDTAISRACEADDERTGVRFELLADSVEVWRSAILRQRRQVEPFSVPIASASRITLRMVLVSSRRITAGAALSTITGVWGGITLVGEGLGVSRPGSLLCCGDGAVLGSTVTADLMGAARMGYVAPASSVERLAVTKGGSAPTVYLRSVDCETGALRHTALLSADCAVVSSVHGLTVPPILGGSSPSDATALQQMDAWSLGMRGACTMLAIASARAAAASLLYVWAKAREAPMVAIGATPSHAAAARSKGGAILADLSAEERVSIMQLLKLAVAVDDTCDVGVVSSTAATSADASADMRDSAASTAESIEESARAYVNSPAALAGIPRAVLLQYVVTRLALEDGTHGMPAGVPSFGNILVDDCLAHLSSCTRTQSTEERVVASPHPLPPACMDGASGRVCIPGAASLTLRYDTRCALPEGTHLELYTAADMSSASHVDTRSGGAGWVSAGIIPGDTVWWRLRASAAPASAAAAAAPSSSAWGFAISVSARAGQWASDANVLAGASASVSWACWLLNFLLADVSAVLRPGVLHNQRTFDALVTVLRTSDTPVRVRSRVLLLLSRLLVAHNMFASVPNLESLSGVEDTVLRAADKALRESGSSGSSGAAKFLSPRLQELLELVVARRGALSAVAIMDAAHKHAASHGTSGSSSSSADAALAAVYALPVEPAVMKSSDSLPTVEKLAIINEISAALLTGSRPRDAIMCSAWAEAQGHVRYVETSHPLRPTDAFTGSVAIEGASSLRVTWDVRCSLPEGASLVLSFGDVSRTFSGTLKRRMGTSEDDSAAARDSATWSAESITVTAAELRYELRGVTGRAPSSLKNHWGVGFTVSKAASRTLPSMDMLAARAADISAAWGDMVTNWNPARDADVVEAAKRVVDAVNSAASTAGTSDRFTLSTLPLEYLSLGDADLSLRYPALSDVPTPRLRLRFAIICMLNVHVRPCLPCFALDSTRTWTLGSRVRRLNYAIFREMKQSILDAALSATRGSSSYGSVVNLSNFKASESVEHGDVTPETSQCMFVQAFTQLRRATSVHMRSIERSDQARVFQAHFDGEDGIDAGGVYREALSRIMDDLFSDHFSLLIKCGNAVTGLAVNASSYVPNPEMKTPLALTMFEFLGRFMGMSMRSRALLPFMFPSIVWKGIVSAPSTVEDLYLMDTAAAQLLIAMRTCDCDISATGEPQEPVTTEEAFARRFPDLRFVILNSAGVEVELCEGGRDVPVTFSNRVRFCDAAERARLHEFDAQLAAMRRGFANVIPTRPLSLFTWAEVEVLVCGDADVDVDYLKRNTMYEGYSSTDEVVERFWRVLRSMTREEKSNYIRFVWGRSRLPLDESGWTSKHKITRIGTGDRSLPMAHTCFCTVDLPAYTTDERMHWGLSTAIHYGLGAILNR